MLGENHCIILLKWYKWIVWYVIFYLHPEKCVKCAHAFRTRLHHSYSCWEVLYLASSTMCFRWDWLWDRILLSLSMSGWIWFYRNKIWFYKVPLCMLHYSFQSYQICILWPSEWDRFLLYACIYALLSPQIFILFGFNEITKNNCLALDLCILAIN